MPLLALVCVEEQDARKERDVETVMGTMVMDEENVFAMETGKDETGHLLSLDCHLTLKLTE